MNVPVYPCVTGPGARQFLVLVQGEAGDCQGETQWNTQLSLVFSMSLHFSIPRVVFKITTVSTDSPCRYL